MLDSGSPVTASMPSVLFAGLGLLVMGSIATLPFIGYRRIGRGFYALIIGCSLILMLLLLGAFPGAPDQRPLWLFRIHIAWILLSGFWLGLSLTAPDRWLSRLLILVYGLSLAWYYTFVRLMVHNGAGTLPEVLLSTLFSGLLMGSVSVGMVLGHWYLVNRRLSIRALIRCSFFFFLISLLRTLWAILMTLMHLSAWSFVKNYVQLISIFTFQRWAYGLILPPIFAWMIYQTARIRSTQSATGILYAAMVVTLMGELIGIYLWIHRGLIH